MRHKAAISAVAIVAIGFLAFGPTAEAASVNSLIQSLVTPHSEGVMIDDSLETLIVDNGTPGVLDVGDVLFGVFNINLLGQSQPTTNTTGIGTYGISTPNNELTGVFQIVLLDKYSLSNGDVVMTFGPDSSFTLANSLGVGASSVGGKGAMVLFFEDSTPDFSASGTLLTDVANAIDGKFFWAMGFTSDLPTDDYINEATGEFWSGTFKTDNLANPFYQNQPINSANFAMNRVFSTKTANNSDPIPGLGDGWVLDLRQSSEYSGVGKTVEFTGFTTPTLQNNNQTWPARDAAQFNFNPVSLVPVPAAAWMGLALLGALGLGRRLRRKE